MFDIKKKGLYFCGAYDVLDRLVTNSFSEQVRMYPSDVFTLLIGNMYCDLMGGGSKRRMLYWVHEKSLYTLPITYRIIDKETGSFIEEDDVFRMFKLMGFAEMPDLGYEIWEAMLGLEGRLNKKTRSKLLQLVDWNISPKWEFIRDHVASMKSTSIIS